MSHTCGTNRQAEYHTFIDNLGALPSQASIARWKYLFLPRLLISACPHLSRLTSHAYERPWVHATRRRSEVPSAATAAARV